MSYQSFMRDMAALLRRKKEDIGKRQSLFQDVSPGNVGNVFDVPPSDAQFANTYDNGAYGIPIRILEIVGDDALGEMICVSIQQERILDDAESVFVGNDTVEGPLVGMVEFGAGSGLSAFEFDIPTPIVSPGFINVRNANSQDATTNWDDKLFPFRRLNGVLLSLPASSMRVFVRNDANAPYLIQGGGTAGPPPVFSSLPAVSLNTFKRAAKVRVHATYGRRPYPHTLTRTIPICFSEIFSGNQGPTAPFEALQDNAITIMIPPYAHKVYFPRFPVQASSLSVNFFQSPLRSATGSAFRGNITVPVGDEGPLDIYPLDSFIQVRNMGPNTIENFSLVFELKI